MVQTRELAVDHYSFYWGSGEYVEESFWIIVEVVESRLYSHYFQVEAVASGPIRVSNTCSIPVIFVKILQAMLAVGDVHPQRHQGRFVVVLCHP